MRTTELREHNDYFIVELDGTMFGVAGHMGHKPVIVLAEQDDNHQSPRAELEAGDFSRACAVLMFKEEAGIHGMIEACQELLVKIKESEFAEKLT